MGPGRVNNRAPNIGVGHYPQAVRNAVDDEAEAAVSRETRNEGRVTHRAIHRAGKRSTSGFVDKPAACG